MLTNSAVVSVAVSVVIRVRGPRQANYQSMATTIVIAVVAAPRATLRGSTIAIAAKFRT